MRAGFAYTTRVLLPLVLLAIGCDGVVVVPLVDPTVMFNSESPGNNAVTRASWLAAAGITDEDVEFLVDFETGFVDGENVSGLTDVFPGGLVIDNVDHTATVNSGNVFKGSNPVGVFALRSNEEPYVILDFSVQPVDYVGFQDIDQFGTTGIVELDDGSAWEFEFETTNTGGDSAEFFGIVITGPARITRVLLDASGDGIWGVDNIEFGRVP